MRAQARAMYELADDAACRHQALAWHFEERIEPCRTSCDICAYADVLAAAPAPEAKSRRRAVRHTPAPTPEAAEAFEVLRGVRSVIAREAGVPAYIVFTDAALLEMALSRPGTLDELREIPGVGPKRCARYGERFLEALQAC